ncbi:Glycosyltransferase [Acidihalobacter prosperus]|uniref:Glycosyltransferase n=1 Tax=Acidihalobacter prosperus TaxID=160660 RepID=A0A1A6C610_9GAMM|nr:Glycosyltransferase [Acidihalobacter prosperus]
MEEKRIPPSDVIVATAWQTAEWIATYGSLPGKKYYLIHDYEHYMVARSEVKKRMCDTYRAGFVNIITSPAGAALLRQCGADYDAYIPNGIDFNIYNIKQSVDSIGRRKIGFPTRRETFKGTADAIKALSRVREVCGHDLDIWSFGPKKPNFMPDWVEYHERPRDSELCDLYNASMIFLMPSHYEGWGLPGAEAMSCGAALVSTDNVGVRAYAKDNVNALLSPPADIDALASNVVDLLRDAQRRFKISQAGVECIREFSWRKSLIQLNDLISNHKSI